MFGRKGSLTEMLSEGAVVDMNPSCRVRALRGACTAASYEGEGGCCRFGHFSQVRFVFGCLLAIAATVFCTCCFILVFTRELAFPEIALSIDSSNSGSYASTRLLLQSTSATVEPASSLSPASKPQQELPKAHPPSLVNGSITLLLSHSPRVESTATETCRAEVKKLVVSRSGHELYYVLHHYCVTDDVQTDYEMSIRKTNLSRWQKGNGSTPVDDDKSVVITYMWPNDEPNGTRIAKGMGLGEKDMAEVTGMFLSRDGGHLVLSTSSAPHMDVNRNNWTPVGDDNTSMFTSLSIADGSRVSYRWGIFIQSWALNYESGLMYLSSPRSAIKYSEVDDLGLPDGDGFGFDPDWYAVSGSVFQSQSLVSDGSCLYYAQSAGEVFGINPDSSKPNQLTSLSNPTDIVTTPEGCLVFMASRASVVVLPVVSSCKDLSDARLRRLEEVDEMNHRGFPGIDSYDIDREEFMGLALHADANDLILYVGGSDGNLFRVPLNRTAVGGCDGPSDIKLLIILGATGCCVFVAMIGILIWIWRRRRRRHRASKKQLEGVEPFWGLRPSRVKQFALETLLDCTDNFSETHRVGDRGAFGKVYRGVLDGKDVAMKVMTGELTPIKRNQFVAEVNTLSAVNHVNLIQLVGYCQEGNQCILVYPYFSGGCLHRRLFHNKHNQSRWDKDSLPPLTLQDRMSITFQVAKGLWYLHDDAKPPIIHRDIKSQNVLLENGCDKTPHVVVADFGLAAIGERVLDTGHDHVALTSHIGGTFGYMSPEYMLRGELSEKNDVYSFGVLVLELLTGRKVVAPAPSGVGWQTLVDWVRPFLQDGGENAQDQCLAMPRAILDPCLWDQVVGVSTRQMVMSAYMLAWECVHEEYGSRPAMRSAVQRIHSMLLDVGWDFLTRTMDMENLLAMSQVEDHVPEEGDDYLQEHRGLLLSPEANVDCKNIVTPAIS